MKNIAKRIALTTFLFFLGNCVSAQQGQNKKPND